MRLILSSWLGSAGSPRGSALPVLLVARLCRATQVSGSAGKEKMRVVKSEATDSNKFPEMEA